MGEFRRAAQKVYAAASGRERDSIKEALDFWESRLPSFNIEEFFGFVESDALMKATGEIGRSTLKDDALFLIAKVITATVRQGVSQVHFEFVRKLEDFVPIITLNWDILLDSAILANERSIEYGLKAGHWDPYGRERRSMKLLKLHGSLNWIKCRGCSKIQFLTEKEPVTSYLLHKKGLTCAACSSTEFEVLMVPPVLSKLTEGHPELMPIWQDSFATIVGSERVFIVGYSFPPSDIQTKLLLCKALRQASGLQEICVITRPKFGGDRTRFEDKYADALSGSEQLDALRFEYRTFGHLPETLPL